MVAAARVAFYGFIVSANRLAGRLRLGAPRAGGGLGGLVFVGQDGEDVRAGRGGGSTAERFQYRTSIVAQPQKRTVRQRAGRELNL